MAGVSLEKRGERSVSNFKLINTASCCLVSRLRRSREYTVLTLQYTRPSGYLGPYTPQQIALWPSPHGFVGEQLVVIIR